MKRILKCKLNLKSMADRLNSLPGKFSFLQSRIRSVIAVALAATGFAVALVAFSAQPEAEYVDVAAVIERPCAPWEMYSPELAEAEAGGGGRHTFESIEEAGRPIGNAGWSTGATSRLSGPAMPGSGGVTSSGPGCLAPCYLILNDAEDARLDLIMLDDDAYVFDHEGRAVGRRVSPMADAAKRYPLRFDTSNRPPLSGNSYRGEVRVGVTYSRQKTLGGGLAHTDISQRHLALSDGANTDYVWNTDVVRDPSYIPSKVAGTHVPPTDRDYTVAIMVTKAQDGCVVYNTTTGEIYLDSRKA